MSIVLDNFTIDDAVVLAKTCISGADFKEKQPEAYRWAVEKKVLMEVLRKANLWMKK